MDDDLFNALREQIDAELNAAPDAKGIAMGFRLAGEFWRRGLLADVKFTMMVDWESKTYRDRHVYPDPMMDDEAYRIGSPVA